MDAGAKIGRRFPKHAQAHTARVLYKLHFDVPATETNVIQKRELDGQKKKKGKQRINDKQVLHP